MSTSPEAAALALLCRPDGTLVEVIYDELGLAPGTDVFSLFHASSLRKARRFLRAAVASHSALDWELTVSLPGGVVQLFFCAVIASRGIVIVGMKEPASSREFPKSVLQKAGAIADPRALQELDGRRKSKLRARRRLRRELSRLNGALAAPSAEAGAKASSNAKHVGANQLIRMLAHDLRNPISGILSASQYLIDDAASTLDRDHVMLLRSIESSSALLLRLIEDLVELPSAGLGKPRFHFQPTDLAALVDQSAAVYRPLAEARNIRLEVARDEEIPLIPLDPLKIRQSLNALLTNAVRSSPPSGDIEVRIAVQPKSVVITVHDITAFDPGLQPARRTGASTRARPGADTLTLSVVRRIAEGHGGSLRVEKAGWRPAFRLTLPRTRPARTKTQSSAAR
jgi:signal transduction histidine kinase